MKRQGKSFGLLLSAGLGGMLALAGTGPLAAQGTSDDKVRETAARYGVRPSVLNVSLSPSGNKVAFVAPGPEHSDLIKVVDLAGDAKVKTISSNTEEHIDILGCDWVTEQRLACQIYGVTENSRGLLLFFTRVLVMNDDGSDLKSLTVRSSSRALGFRQDGGNIVALDVPGEEGRILLTREYVKERTTGTRLANDEEGLGVDSVDVVTGRRVPVEDADPRAARYIADENGNIRLKVRQIDTNTGMLTGESRLVYRPKGGEIWTGLGDIVIDGTPTDSFYPVAVNGQKNVVYGFATVNGYRALAEVRLDGSGQGKVLLARDDVDVDRLIRIGRKRRVVGVSYATEKRNVVYFDPELKALANALSKALPNTPLISIAGASADESKLLIIASSDTDPGMVYLYDKSKRGLERLLAMREYLVDQPLGKMTPITYPARDGTEIPGYLTLPPGAEAKDLPAIVMPHGGPGLRDEWGFDWLVQFFTARGFAVLQPNYCGSAGYGEAWYGRNGFKAWKTAIGDVNDAGRWLVSEGIADADKLAIVGWSYGGYAALQSQVLDPDLFKGVVAIAPVTDLDYLRNDARRYTNARLIDEFIGSGPHVRAGSPRRHAEKFAAPVALYHGALDLNVAVRHSRAMKNELREAGKQVVYREYDHLQHSLRDSKVRSEMLSEIAIFLDDALDR